MRFIPYLLLLVTTARAQGIIARVAGEQLAPLQGTMPALSAPLGNVTATVIDAAGRLYTIDSSRNQILRIDTSGNSTTIVVAGNGAPAFSGDGGPATAASLNGPLGLAIDGDGTLYVADTNNYRIRKITTDGIITTFAGNGRPEYSGDGKSALDAGFIQPAGLAFDSVGSLYIVDAGAGSPGLGGRLRKVTRSGIISTIAGNGSTDASGDGGPALNAGLGKPLAIAFDRLDNLYLTDVQYQRIRKISAGVITTIANAAGVLPPAEDSIYVPTSITVDSLGNVFFTDSANLRVRRIDSKGNITTVAGGGDFTAGIQEGIPALAASLSFPSGIAVDRLGNLYISDTRNHRIRKVLWGSGYPQVFIGTITTFAGNDQANFGGDGGPAAAAHLNGPRSARADGLGNIYIADSGNNRIRRVSSDGTITTVAGDGRKAFSGDGGTAAHASLNQPTALAIDSSNNVYVSDCFNNRIRKISADGLIDTVAGNGSPVYAGDGAKGAAVSFNCPADLVVDGGGSLYFSDASNNMIRKISPSGTVVRVAGTGQPGFAGDGGLAVNARLNFPVGLALDRSGSLYFVDAGNLRIRRIGSDGVITTVAGNGTGLSGDGGPAIAAGLGPIGGPIGLAIDSGNEIFLADGAVIRMISSDGLISTVAGTGYIGSTGDGGPASSATLNQPFLLSITPAGDLLISDPVANNVRAVLAKLPSYQVAPTTLTLSAPAGGGVIGPVAIHLSSPVAGLTFQVSTSTSWLTINPSTGAMPADVQVLADPATLHDGTYDGLITVTSPYSSTPIMAIKVTLVLSVASPPVLNVDSNTISFNAIQGGFSQNQILRVSNLGGGILSYDTSVITTSGGDWLSVSSSKGTASPSASATLSVNANLGSLGPGTYRGTIRVNAADGAVLVPVVLSITAPTAVILTSLNAVAFTAVAQGGVPLPQTLGILNTGNGPMAYKTSATTLNGGSWLKMSSASGVVTNPYVDISSLDLSVDPTGLGPGVYYGKIQVEATAINSPQVLTVVLTVLAEGSSPGIEVRPTGLIFIGKAGASPGSQDVLVGNPKRQPDSFISGRIGSGFSYLPTNANVLANQPITVRIFPDFSNLTPGSFQKGTITLQFANDEPRVITVLNIVAPDGLNGLTDAGTTLDGLGSPKATGCSTSDLVIQFRAPVQNGQSSFTAILGQPTTIEVQVADRCGNLIGPGSQSAQVAAYFSTADPQVSMTHIGNGIWQGTWRPLNQSGSVVLKVTAFVVQSGTLVGGVSTALTGTVNAFAPAATTPTVTAKGVVDAASSQSGLPIAPGGLITIYGVNLADGIAQSSGLPLPQQLSGARVLLGDKPLPILYTSSGQLNVQVPYSVPVNTQYQLTVQHGDALSVPQSLVVAQAQPGIFTVNQQGTGQGSIVKSDQLTVAQPGTPASVGETVVIYCSALGAVTPEVAAGDPAPLKPPLSTTMNPVTVMIGGREAQVLFSGLTPGYSGLYQINAVVPSGITPGDAVPVVISVAGQTSLPVSMAVK